LIFGEISMVEDSKDKDTKEKQVEEKIERLENRIEELEKVSHKQSEDIAFLSRGRPRPELVRRS